MRNFKLQTGSCPVYTISKDEFETQTRKHDLYYRLNSNGEPVQYAVCPGCDNPIRLIGLYKKLQNTDRPYGKHHMRDVEDLAAYNQQAYTYCPYASHRLHVTPEDRKVSVTGFEKAIYELMRNQFDRVVYIWSKQIDIKITSGIAEKRLTEYVASEGWLYPWATLNNLPWMYGYLTGVARSLYNQLIRKDSPLYEAILRSCPEAEFIPSEYFDDYERLRNKPGFYLDVKYCILNHKRQIVDDVNVETVEMIVWRKKTGADFIKSTQEGVDTDDVFYRKKLEIDEKYFLNLVNMPQEKAQRNTYLLEAAQRIMPPLQQAGN